MLHHVPVSSEHATVGVALLQDDGPVADVKPPEIAELYLPGPGAALTGTGHHSLNGQRILFPERLERLQIVQVRPPGHAAQIPKAALFAQRPKLPLHLNFQRQAAGI